MRINSVLTNLNRTVSGIQNTTIPSTGFRGFQGDDNIGIQGEIGFQGSISIINPLINERGFQGDTGSISVIDGFQGDLGYGFQGFTGYKGVTGYKGRQGYKGPQGLQGITGKNIDLGGDTILDASITIIAQDVNIGSTIIPIERFCLNNIIGSTYYSGITYYGGITYNTWRPAVFVYNNVMPNAPITYNIGSQGARWRDAYLSGNTINLGNAFISKSSSSISYLTTGETGTTTYLANTDSATGKIDISLLPISSYTYGFSKEYTNGETADWVNQIYSIINEHNIYYDGIQSPSLPIGTTYLTYSSYSNFSGAYYMIQLSYGATASLNIPTLYFDLVGEQFKFEYGQTYTDNYQDFVSGDVILFEITKNAGNTYVICELSKIDFNTPFGVLTTSKLADSQ
ncbi:MAG: hypothetical protein WCG90_08985 [Chitinophagia bacterium]